LPIYATGFFNGNIYFMTGILMPLWAIILVGPEEPFLIGLIVASRQFAPVLFSIQGGTLMDRFGARRIMLALGLMGAVTMAAFPQFPFVGAVMLLQLLSGFAESTCWIGSQALVGSVLRGNPVYAGRLSFFLRCGGFAGPLLSGYAWHAFGPEAGFYFMAGWIFCGWLAGYLVPAKAQPSDAELTPKPTAKLRDLVPRASDYIETFKLAFIPAVGLMAACTMVRQTGSVMQVSFYPVWLNQLGVTAFDIGFMVGVSHIVSAGSSLSVGTYTRWVREHWLLVATIGLSVLFTPPAACSRRRSAPAGRNRGHPASDHRQDLYLADRDHLPARIRPGDQHAADDVAQHARSARRPAGQGGGAAGHA